MGYKRNDLPVRVEQILLVLLSRISPAKVLTARQGRAVLLKHSTAMITTRLFEMGMHALAGYQIIQTVEEEVVIQQLRDWP